MTTLDYFDEICTKPFISKVLRLEIGNMEFRLFISLSDQIEYRGFILKIGKPGWLYQIKIGDEIEMRKYIPQIGFNGPGVFNQEVKQ